MIQMKHKLTNLPQMGTLPTGFSKIPSFWVMNSEKVLREDDECRRHRMKCFQNSGSNKEMIFASSVDIDERVFWNCVLKIVEEKEVIFQLTLMKDRFFVKAIPSVDVIKISDKSKEH